jgi:hypothetical protein
VRIGELAGLVGISTRAIRHYHRIGLLAEPARKANGYRVLNADPGAAEQAYAVYVRLDGLAALPADDPRVEETARALVAAIPETVRKEIPFPEGELEDMAGGFAAAFYADFAPAQAAAIRRAIDLMRKS